MHPPVSSEDIVSSVDIVNSEDIAVRVRDLTLRLGTRSAPVEILKGIDLDIPRGECLAILGASGSGKSSLMAVLSGLEGATGGTVSIDGVEFGSLSEDELARARRGRIGIILQSFHLLPTMSALENVAVPMELSGADGPFDRAAAELELVGLGHRLHHYPAQLSGGEQQRVAIARAMAPRTAILFADEPTGNLDASTGAKIIDMLFARQHESGATLIVITHDPALAERCDRIIEMRDGRIIADRRT